MEPIIPKVMFENCPIRASLGCLGRKWALLVLRDVSFFAPISFTRIMRQNSGLTPRVLSMRLNDLQAEGLIERAKDAKSGEDVGWQLTKMGRDAVPILTAFIQFGIRHHADEVFADDKPRALAEIFPGRRDYMLQRLLPYAKQWSGKD